MISSDSLAFIKRELIEAISYCKYQSIKSGTPGNINDIWNQIERLNKIVEKLVQEIEESQLEEQE